MKRTRSDSGKLGAKALNSDARKKAFAVKKMAQTIRNKKITRRQLNKKITRRQLNKIDLFLKGKLPRG